jgi:hypothetical protein
MNLTTFKTVLPFILDVGATPWLWGRHAVGKTETVEKYYLNQGYKFFNIRLNTQSDLGDILGLQEFTTDKATGEKIATKFCYPDWITDLVAWCEANPDKRGCIFIDEVNRAARLEMIGPIFQMSLDRRLHTLPFPANLDVILASNPDTKDYSLLSLKDKALMSRFWHCHFDPSKEEFFTYAESEKADVELLAFLKEQPAFLEEATDTFSISEYAKPDRRKWLRYVSPLKANTSFPEKHLGETIAGFIGQDTVLAFEVWLNSREKPFELKDLLKSYNAKFKKEVEKCVTDGKTDKINDLGDKICKFALTGDDITKKQIENILNFLNDIPNDIMFKVMHSCYDKRKFFDACESVYSKCQALTSIEEKLKAVYESIPRDADGNRIEEKEKAV